MLHVVGPSIISAALASCTPAPPSVGHRRPVGRQADGGRESISSSFPSSPPVSYPIPFFLVRMACPGLGPGGLAAGWPPTQPAASSAGPATGWVPGWPLAQPVQPPAQFQFCCPGRKPKIALLREIAHCAKMGDKITYLRPIPSPARRADLRLYYCFKVCFSSTYWLSASVVPYATVIPSLDLPQGGGDFLTTKAFINLTIIENMNFVATQTWELELYVGGNVGTDQAIN